MSLIERKQKIKHVWSEKSSLNDSLCEKHKIERDEVMDGILRNIRKVKREYMY